MDNQDLLQRFIFDKLPIRGEYINLQETYQTIAHQHDYPPPIRELLGEALCVAGLLSAIIKFSGRLTVQFRGKGKLKLLLAQCDNQFQMRGLVKWEGGDDISQEDIVAAFQDGVMAIMLDSNKQNRYQGIVPWQGNSLAESIEGYFKNSEQLATKIWLSVNQHVAVGFLLQVIPSADKNLQTIESEITESHWPRILGLTSSLSGDDLLSVPYEELLKNTYPDDEVRIFPHVPIVFRCTCSRENGENAIFILGKEEAEEELRDKHSIIVTCDFCNTEYIFDRVDVTNIFINKRDPSSDPHLH